MRAYLLTIQVLTYIALGLWLAFGEGLWKLGAAQLCLAVVQGLVFS